MNRIEMNNINNNNSQNSDDNDNNIINKNYNDSNSKITLTTIILWHKK